MNFHLKLLTLISCLYLLTGPFYTLCLGMATGRVGHG